MALSILEQIQFAKTGTRGDSTATIKEIVQQVAISHASTFIKNSKVFNTIDPTTQAPINQEAEQYLRKIQGVINRVFRDDRQTLQLLQSILFYILGQSTFTANQVENATTNQWVTFFENNIAEAYEIAGIVMKDEKDQYEALP